MSYKQEKNVSSGVQGDKVTITGITCQRDDGPYLTEWIAHHLAAGVDRMLVLSHECSDGSHDLLDALSHDPRICHVPFNPRGAKTVQWQALKLIKEHPWYQQSEWALFFDCDEFLCLPGKTTTLADQIDEFERSHGAFDALTLPWRLFGSGGVSHMQAGLTPERFTKAAPQDLHFPFAHLFKTLHRPSAFRQPGVHRPRSKPSKPAIWIDGSGHPLPEWFAANDAAITLYSVQQQAPKLWLNHYSLRSKQEFMVKRARGLPNHSDREVGLTYWAERNWNALEATDILPMLDATKAMMADLMKQPKVTHFHKACVAWHQEKFKHIMTDIDAVRLHFRLGFLTSSTPPSAEDGQRFLAAQRALLQSGGQIK